MSVGGAETRRASRTLVSHRSPLWPWCCTHKSHSKASLTKDDLGRQLPPWILNWQGWKTLTVLLPWKQGKLGKRQLRCLIPQEREKIQRGDVVEWPRLRIPFVSMKCSWDHSANIADWRRSGRSQANSLTVCTVWSQVRNRCGKQRRSRQVYGSR